MLQDRLPDTAKGIRPAVFLDRDGVLNRTDVVNGKPYAPRQLSRFRLLPGVREAVSRLRNAGLLTIVVTNQPDIGNGFVDPAVVEAMHKIVSTRLQVDEIKMCPHSQGCHCNCRKPAIGLLIEAAQKWQIDLKRSYFVGDRGSDIVSGHRAGCYTVFVDRGYKEQVSEQPEATAPNLPHSVDIILEHFRKSEGYDL